MTMHPIYLDNNATTSLEPRVLEAMIPFMQEQFHNPSSAYRGGAEARAAVERARKTIADTLHCARDEIVFCSCGTEANNLAIRGVLQTAKSDGGGHLITSVIEHPAVLETVRALASQGAAVTEVPVSSDGVLRFDVLEEALRPDTRLISVMCANNETGVLQPVREIAEAAASRRILFHMDAVQAAGKMPLDFEQSGADLISVSGHKIHGPKGIGLLYVRRNTPVAPLLTGGGQEGGLRSGTENVPAIVGLAQAVRIATERLDVCTKKMKRLRDRFEAAVTSALPDVVVLGAAAPRLCNTSALILPGVDGESAVLGADLSGVQISTGSACASGDETPSHVLLAMGCASRDAQGAVRVSLSKLNTEEEIDFAANALIQTVRRLRALSTL